MKKLFFILLFLIVLPVLATHIVGGEFELLHISGETYRLNMILYFDEIHGSVGAKDKSATAYIYRKSDNAQMDSVVLLLKDSSEVNYSKPECSDGLVRTLKYTFTNTVKLSAARYSDPLGYYVSWQRCCRNYTIANIYSEDPNVPGQYDAAAGQTFYLEFPAVVKGGTPFYNSSPKLFPPLNDYACPYRPYYVDFEGTDDDGDSLVYSLTTPLDTRNHDAFPGHAPAALTRLVQWRPGYSLQHIMLGQPDMAITTDGLLTVKPTYRIGLFVFAVKIEQFRDKIKIGETRRDFQIVVADGCAPDAAPVVSGKSTTETTYSHTKKMFVNFPNGTSDADRCVQIRVSDDDSNSPANNFSENVTVRVVPLNFSPDLLAGYLPGISTTGLANGSTKDFTICFPKCPPTQNFAIDIIAADDACTLPQLDTLHLIVNVQVPGETEDAFVDTDLTSDPREKIVKLTKHIGESVSFNVTATQVDDHPIRLLGKPEDFKFVDYSMTFPSVAGVGTTTSQFNWDITCDNVNPNKKSVFDIWFIVRDTTNYCKVTVSDTVTVEITVEPPQNAPAQLRFQSLNAVALDGDQVTLVLGQSLAINVIGTDPDNGLVKDSLALKLYEATGAIPPEGYDFQNVNGIKSISSPLTWTPDCSIFRGGVFSNDYQFKFLLDDGVCYNPQGDSLTLNVTVKDVESDFRYFNPGNIITPNGDLCNDFFAAADLDNLPINPRCPPVAEDLDAYVHLPLDNCVGHFQYIAIVNRWGKEVFRSTTRDFRWYGEGVETGVYYYFVEFGVKQFKGTVSVRK